MRDVAVLGVFVAAMIGLWGWNSWQTAHESAFICDVQGHMWVTNDFGHTFRYPQRVKDTWWCKKSAGALNVVTFPGRPTWLLIPSRQVEKWDDNETVRDATEEQKRAVQ